MTSLYEKFLSLYNAELKKTKETRCPAQFKVFSDIIKLFSLYWRLNHQYPNNNAICSIFSDIIKDLENKEKLTEEEELKLKILKLHLIKDYVYTKVELSNVSPSETNVTFQFKYDSENYLNKLKGFRERKK